MLPLLAITTLVEILYPLYFDKSGSTVVESSRYFFFLNELLLVGIIVKCAGGKQDEGECIFWFGENKNCPRIMLEYMVTSKPKLSGKNTKTAKTSLHNCFADLRFALRVCEQLNFLKFIKNDRMGWNWPIR